MKPPRPQINFQPSQNWLSSTMTHYDTQQTYFTYSLVFLFRATPFFHCSVFFLFSICSDFFYLLFYGVFTLPVHSTISCVSQPIFCWQAGRCLLYSQCLWLCKRFIHFIFLTETNNFRQSIKCEQMSEAASKVKIK